MIAPQQNINYLATSNNIHKGYDVTNLFHSNPQVVGEQKMIEYKRQLHSSILR